MKNATGPFVIPGLLALFAVSNRSAAQTFQFANNQLPQGPPFNNSFSENVDFADVDLDGDMDAALADGGDCCNDQNRLWVNLGFAQGGTLGFFADVTAVQCPNVLDDSRDVDFADIDNDGDADLHASNTSQISNQSNRFWVNLGGLQGGTAGFFQDDTAARWLGVGVNNGTTECSSIPGAFVLGGGGFVDWTADSVFADFDNDGDLDLVHSSHGGSFSGNVPTRLFANDGTGRFREFNPSCAASLVEGGPALWAEGVQKNGTLKFDGSEADIKLSPLGAEVCDLEADFDLDFLIGSLQDAPRLFRNVKKEVGLLLWRDVTFAQLSATFPVSNHNYEQELGDMDHDGDQDLVTLAWSAFDNEVSANDSAGTFGAAVALPGTGTSANEADWFDYDADGNPDIFLGNFSGQDRLYKGDGAGGFTNVTASELPADNSITLGQDSCDVDLDGDYDLILANDAGQPNTLLKNVGQVPDSTAASLPHLEQALDRLASALPTVVRAHVVENASWDVARYDAVVVEYQVNGGSFSSAAMRYAGGQLFRGEIPGAVVGTIGYRVRATDEHGNVGLSGLKSYVASAGSCSGSIAGYCTSKISSSGCVPAMASSGAPSLFAADLFEVRAQNLEQGQNGIVFFGTSGPAGLPFQDGFLCANAPLYRLPVKNSGGAAACSGLLKYTLSELVTQPQGGSLLVAGQQVQLQAWFRDPPAASTTGLTNGLQLTVCP